MSKTFKDICGFKKGESYWENNQGGCIRFTVKDDAEINDTSAGNQVSFIGVTSEGQEIEYMVTEHYEHYCPTISDYKEYYTWEEIQATIVKER
jgi:hypothetical protein